jgi:hypothetical protein
VKFELEEINSGQDDDFLWVMLGFSSTFQQLDTLYIVCPATVTSKDIPTETYGLYYERFDQLYSCYDAADRITITANTVELAFSPEGAKSLNFDGPVTFQCPPRLKGLSDARKILQRMAKHPNVPIN